MAKAFRTSARLDSIARAQYLPVGMRYLLAALVTAAALLLRLGLGRFIGPHTPFSTMYPAIAFSALFLGIGPSLMCTLAGLVAVKIFFLLPGRPFLTALDLELSAAYLVMAALLILVGEISNRSRRRAERAEADLKEANDALEIKVDERTRDLANSLEKLQAEMEVRSQKEEQLSELSARLIRLQDEERRRIARDLHDSTGQTLAAIKLTLAAFRNLIPESPQTADLLCDLEMLTDQAVHEVRTTSHLLHPPLLDEVGFSSAARWYVDGFEKRSGIKTTLVLDSVPALPKACELVFFRVLQESLTNVLRHSGSSSVEISMESDTQNAILCIRDHGAGIPAEKLNAFRKTGAGVGVGLAGMKQRIAELGGEFHIDSDPGGTCVKASLPTKSEVQVEEKSSAAD
jgi:signal transduction histidine kinase